MVRSELLSAARKCDDLGYGTFVMPDHMFDTFGIIPTLMTVADNCPGLRVGTYVLCNDFHHPVVMAKEAATLDVLSEGRLELGLGAGYIPAEYNMAGIPFERGSVRLQRLTETVHIVKMAFAGETFSFDGDHYQVRDYTPYPVPTQQPRPPLLLGGGGPGLLTLAAAEADIVSVLPAAASGGGLRGSQLGLKSLKEKVTLVREAAGDRWADLEINILIFDAVVTRDRRAAAEAYLGPLLQGGQFIPDGEVTADDLLDSPYFAFGTDKDIAEHLVAIREETGASYVVVFPHLMEAFGPVVELLAH